MNIAKPARLTKTPLNAVLLTQWQKINISGAAFATSSALFPFHNRFWSGAYSYLIRDKKWFTSLLHSFILEKENGDQRLVNATTHSLYANHCNCSNSKVLFLWLVIILGEFNIISRKLTYFSLRKSKLGLCRNLVSKPRFKSHCQKGTLSLYIYFEQPTSFNYLLFIHSFKRNFSD